MTRRRILVRPPSWNVSVSSVCLVMPGCEPEELCPDPPVIPEEPDASLRSLVFLVPGIRTRRVPTVTRVRLGRRLVFPAGRVPRRPGRVAFVVFRGAGA